MELNWKEKEILLISLASKKFNIKNEIARLEDLLYNHSSQVIRHEAVSKIEALENEFKQIENLYNKIEREGN